ncbi:SDR family NAD(P)-dependent oxidoreductase [Microbacterium sp. NPDC057407]|uniref:SDR family NAD(P)-dependent oxidoreductase n=1 Tax=Microbacterium sp. NPDC057407 TaxID=3346120 RepID=UPI00366E1DF5
MTQSDISPTVLLTGPTSGIGAAILARLVRHPSRPRLVLVGRDAGRLRASAGVARGEGLRVDEVQLDLTDLRSVQSGLERIASLVGSGALPTIDVAILNAGAQYYDRRRTSAQGWEATFAVNVVAQHLLVRGIRPLLSQAGHVVLLGSSTHRGKRASFNLVPDPQWAPPAVLATAQPPATGAVRPAAEREQGGIAYASSKLALVTLSHVWAARLADDGRRLNTYDPGLVAGTGLGRDMVGYRYWVWRRLMPAMSVLPGATTPSNTARHAVALALGDAHPALHDGYVEIGRLTRAEDVTFDAQRQAQLWEWLEAATAAYVPHPQEGRAAA